MCACRCRREHGTTTVGIVGGGPAGLMLSPPAGAGRHRLRRRRQPAPASRSSRPSAPASWSGTACGCWSTPASPTGCCARATSTTGSSSRFGGDGAPDRLRRTWSAPRSGSTRRPTCSSTWPTPARGDGGDVRFGVTDTTVADLTATGRALRFTDADGRPARGPLRLPGRRRRVPQHLPPADPGAGPAAVLPGVPVRVVRHPLRGAEERARADLQPLRARVRADQPAHRDACSGCTSSATRTRTSTPGPTTGSGPSCRPGSAPTASPSQEGPITEKTVLPVPQLRLRADALRPAAAGRRRRAHRAADRRQGAQPRPGRRTGAGRGARTRGRPRSDRARWTTTPSGRWPGSGRRSTSRTG